MNTCWADVRCPTCQSWRQHLTLSGCHMAPWRLLAWDWKSRCNRPISCVMTCRRTGWGKAVALYHWDKVGQSPSEHHCRFVWTGPCFLSLLLGSTLSCAATPKILLTSRWWQGHTSRPDYLWPTFYRPWTLSSSLVQTFHGGKYSRLMALPDLMGVIIDALWAVLPN